MSSEDHERGVTPQPKQLSRRQFLQVAVAGSTAIAGAALAACGGAPAAAPTTAPTADAAAPTVAATAPAAAATAPAAGVTAPAVSSGAKLTIPLFTTENDPNTLDFYKRAIASFRQQYPEIDVAVTLYQDETQVQYLTTAFQTGADLGIFAPPSSFIAPWAEQGELLALDPLIQKLGADDFLKGTRVTVGGKDYAMPFQSNASALWVRKDLIEKEGLPLPTTYEQYLAIAKTFSGKDGMVGVSTGVGTVPQLALQYFSPFIYQSGWDYFDKQGNLTFDKPEVLEAVKRFSELLKYASPGLYNATYPDILNTFIAGRSPLGTFPGRMGVNLAAKAPDIAEKTTVVALPAGPFQTANLFFGGIQHYVISSKTAHPQETLAFLEHLTTGERSLDFAMTVPGHLLPPLESVRKLVPSYKSDFMSKHGEWVTTLLKLAPNAQNSSLSMGSVNNQTYEKISNICPWGAQIWNSSPIDGALFQEILINKKDPEAAWIAASAQLKAAADKWKQENPSWKPLA
ncbi:MAG: extracellular solute-binding protein [Chloroflexales bacterium]